MSAREERPVGRPQRSHARAGGGFLARRFRFGGGAPIGALLGVVALSVVCCATRSGAAPLPPARGYELLADLVAGAAPARAAAVERLIAAHDPSFVPGLVDALFFAPRAGRDDVVRVLVALTGRRLDGYWAWVEYVGSRTDLSPAPGYRRFKARLFARIDARYAHVLAPERPTKIRAEEIVWGGVSLAGIPALVDPAVLPAAQAVDLEPDEWVFGVAVAGAARAYPLRIVAWHEMVDDTVGGEPVVLSYCPLCGSAILYLRRAPDGAIYTFGTSGLLYRSNKLMYDQETRTLWSQLSGEAVVGELVPQGARLAVLPVVRTRWGAWRRAHPETTVLALPTAAAERWGFDYRPGAAERKRRGVSFPVWSASDALPRDALVYVARVEGSERAYPLARLLADRVVDDTLGGAPIVLVAEPSTGAVRAFRRGERRFRPADVDRVVVDEEGGRWRVTEDALVPEAPGQEAARVPQVALRIPGYRSFWFAWSGFHPDGEIYDLEAGSPPP